MRGRNPPKPKRRQSLQRTNAVEASRELTSSSPLVRLSTIAGVLEEVPSVSWDDRRGAIAPMHTAQGLRGPRALACPPWPQPSPVWESACLRLGLCVSTCCDWRGSSLQLCPVPARGTHSATANSGFKTWLTPVDSGCLWWFQVWFQSGTCPRRYCTNRTWSK